MAVLRLWSMGLASSMRRGDALAFRAAGEMAKGFSRMCVFSNSLGSASSLMRVLGLYLSAFGAIPKGFSLTSAIPWFASRDVSGTDISLMRALAVGRVEDSIIYKQMEKILNVSLRIKYI